ncbi:glucans biosynthesis glucosyltransferase MdoH [Brevundimonas sp.]|uniref:glucans biosynthesis glucosyltransferase MdoH n=1 Tax=Brevundimonas sp. TaxID=1871086 RepID=UPI0025F6989D|nr:glucans biosynthesis glucosyltransferase MdoH [Brevundimonas sp.]
MGDFAIRFDGTSPDAVGDPLVWLPEETPLAMPRQSLEAAPLSNDGARATRPADLVVRRLALLTGTVFLTFCVAIAPVILYARHGFSALEVIGLTIFLLLVTAISCWFTSAAIGLWVLMTGREQEDLSFAAHPPAPRTRTAILMPMYNEDASAVFGRLAALDASLARLGAAEHFDIFVLSDSTKLETAAAEAAAYVGFRSQAACRAFYRRRTANTEHKAGNISEWTRRFGGAYDFMIVLDADSGMAGETVLRLVDAMERNTGVGLIQTTPTIIKASTLFARVSQFSVRLYGRVAAAGLAYWSGSDASYWGHNAIIRVKAFAACAGLPILPGAKPFGGNVLSHDVVEAAMLRRAGWGVNDTAALEGST